MEKFNGFSEEMTEVLMGIRFNNNKEWFHANKHRYKEFVHDPMNALASELCQAMNAFDPDFKTFPRVSRANRDIRFSKNKLPYKESKWFFMREDSLSPREHHHPEYFFEIMPDGYHYGVGYWPGPAGMTRFRSILNHNPYAMEEAAQLYENQDIFVLSEDNYKKAFKDNPGGILEKWYIKKSITVISAHDNDQILYSRELFNQVYDSFKLIHPLYKTLREIAVTE